MGDLQTSNAKQSKGPRQAHGWRGLYAYGLLLGLWSYSLSSLAAEAPELQGEVGFEASEPRDPQLSAYQKIWIKSGIAGSVSLFGRKNSTDLLYKLNMRATLSNIQGAELIQGSDLRLWDERYLEQEIRADRATLELVRGSWRLRAGQQELAWGEVLGPSVLDLSNPRDYRQTDQYIKSSEKIPQIMAIAEYKDSEAGLQVFVTPRPEQMLLPSRQNHLAIQEGGLSHEAEYGARFSYFLEGLDLKFYLMHHQNRSPILFPEPLPSGMTLLSLQRYENSISSSFNYAWDSTVLRGEFIRTTAESKDLRDLTAKQLDQGVLAADYTTENQWLFVTQLQSVLPYECQVIAGCSTRQLWGAMQIQKPWFDDSLKTRYFLYRRLDQNTHYQKFEFEWDTGHSAQIRLSYEDYEGFAADGLDFFDRQDRAVFDVWFPFP